MSISQGLDLVVLFFVVSGFISGFQVGLARKIISLIKSIIIFALIITFGPSFNKAFNIFNIDYAFLTSSTINKYVSRLLSRHFINAVFYIVLYFVFSFSISFAIRPFLKKMKNKNILSLNRLGGAIWGVVSNLFILSMVLLFIVPISGLGKEVEKSSAASFLYQLSAESLNSVTDENTTSESAIICTLSRNSLKIKECDYVFQGLLVIISQVTDRSFLETNFGQFADFNESYDYDSAEVKEIFYLYYSSLYAVPALMYLSGKKVSDEMIADSEELIQKLLDYNLMPEDVYENKRLFDSISEIYQYYDLSNYISEIERGFIIV